MIKRSAVTALALLAALVQPAIAEDSKSWSVDTSLSIFSDYMFRGTRLYDGTSIQPSITGNYDTGYGVLSGNLWMHLSGENDSTTESYTELDETIKYTNTIGDHTVGAGIVWYTYPDSDDDIESIPEAFAVVAFDAPLSPVLSYYYDFRKYHSSYAEAGISHSFESLIADGVDLVPFANLGFAWNSEAYYEDSGFVQSTFGGYLNIPVGSNTLVPTINYSAAGDDRAVNELWFGVSFNKSF